VTPYNVDYSVLEAALDRAACPLSFAEVHGGLCGVMCAAGFSGAEQWLEHCLEDCAMERVESEALPELLANVKEDSWAALTSIEFEFTPLLPDDDTGLEERVRALASWCHGFLSGLALGGFRPEAVAVEDRDDVNEVVRDFTEIGKAAMDDVVEEEAGAVSLTELTEFVRVSVQLVFEQLGSASDDPGPVTIH
jgi:uncharacterized protein YgfB (UPF0149 family)